jgi:hypothetical protein
MGWDSIHWSTGKKRTILSFDDYLLMEDASSPKDPNARPRDGSAVIAQKLSPQEKPSPARTQGF